MSRNKVPSIDDLNEIQCLYRYESETGAVIRKVRNGNYGALVGTRADIQGRGGYRNVNCNGKCWPAHRLIWFLKTGIWPSVEIEIDHKDLDKGNNVWSNLRLATRGQNQANSRTYKNSLVKVKGVSPFYYKNSKKPFRARIRKDGKEIFLGLYRTVEEAKEAYDMAAKKLHGEFWRTE